MILFPTSKTANKTMIPGTSQAFKTRKGKKEKGKASPVLINQVGKVAKKININVFQEIWENNKFY